MSRNLEGENISTGFYENLPYNVGKMVSMSSVIDHRCHKIRETDQLENSRLTSKELLYATPLRKSDRKKSYENDELSTSVEYETQKNLSNEGSGCGLENKQIYLKNDGFNINSVVRHVNLDTDHVDSAMEKNLEDRLLLNFLKDTTWIQKKIEARKDSPNISFSRLVHEEHFAKLVHQNMSANFSERSNVINLHNINVAKSLNKSSQAVKNGDKSKTKLCERQFSGECSIANHEDNILLNREWVLKKIAVCAEQIVPSKKNFLGLSATKKNNPTMELYSVSDSTDKTINNSPIYQGCLLIGSNGSGKTSICESILNGVSGTRGLLNRKLLCCYFLDGQNQDSQSLSTFIRSIVLQLLTHSTFGFKENSKNRSQTGGENEISSFDINSWSECNINEAFCSFQDIIKRRSSMPSVNNASQFNLLSKSCAYSTHPPSCSKYAGNKAIKKVFVQDSNEINKISANKRSKIPLAINSRIPINTVASEIGSFNEKMEELPTSRKQFDAKSTSANHIIEDLTYKPSPLPRLKNCKAVIADGYYEKMLNDPEILENLRVENIERNPDECFKRAVLFPLLELSPPRTTLLLLIDSIDENCLSERDMSTSFVNESYKKKSRNIAELLSNHIHLFPKWFFLVCTTKKQAKCVAKMFSGFKRIMLDDLRKSHVVKDVQEYIISRLNTDFRGKIKLSKEIIECLHQLYIKSNGCILYLKKVLDGIKENFFSFREIKLIPCTLNGLYLYICQKSFNKKQYMKIRPILNALLALTGFVEKHFLFNCLRANNYTLNFHEFEKRLDSMKNITVQSGGKTKIKIFHNSFSVWLVDIKFATKKFVCDINEGHVMVSMCYTLCSASLCANNVRKFCYHLIKSKEYLCNKSVELDCIMMLLESQANLKDSLITNQLNCCSTCLNEYKNNQCQLSKTKYMIEQFLNQKLSQSFSKFLREFFKPNLPNDVKIVSLLLEARGDKIRAQEHGETPFRLFELSNELDGIQSELAELPANKTNMCPQHFRNIVNNNMNPNVDENFGNLFLSEPQQVQSHKGRSLIHILASEGNHELLQNALNSYIGLIDLEIEDFNGQTALNIAARHGHLEIVKILLNFDRSVESGRDAFRRADINHVDSDGWAPLRSASWGGHTDVVKFLTSFPECSIDLADKEGRTALRAAAWSGHEDILKILINAGADVNSVDNQGRTSLIAASYMGHYDVVEILLENGADVNHLDLDGRSALCVAALCGSTGYNKVISTLLEHGANADQLDNDGMSPLLVSSFEGNTEVCELLLENGADPDLADFMGRTPLWAACTAGHALVVKLLLFWGCSIDCMDSEGRTVLSIAAAQGNVTTVRQLLDRGLDETHRDNAGWTPLHYAAFEGYHEVCSQILDAGAKIDECDNEGKTPLHLAAQEGRKKCVQTLLKVHNSVVDQKAHDGKTPFRLACLEGRIDCVKILIQSGCDVNSKDADSRTTLYVLALENKLDIVEYLLTDSEVDANIPDNEGRTALHVAAWQGHSAMVKLLISLGNADVNAMDFENRTPLHSCAWQGNDQVMDILLYFGAVPDHACKQGATALGIAAQEGHEKCVSVLLKYGANPYKTDHCGRTPIKLAAKSSRLSILKTFESYTKKDSNEKIKQLDVIELFDNEADKTVSFSTEAFDHLQGNTLGSKNLLSGTHSLPSNNFYENTMQSDKSSLQKRKSVVSSQSTESSNEIVSYFTQSFQCESHPYQNAKSSFQTTPLRPEKHTQGRQNHSRMLPGVDEHQIISNDAMHKDELFDIECISPLYATPPHSPCSELSSPGQMPFSNHFEEVGAIALNRNAISTDYHFARDTHMRIILGNNKSENYASSKSKRSGISINPAVRLFRSRIDSAAQLIRKTNNILNINSNSNRGSSSIGVRSGTFQWKKENQM